MPTIRISRKIIKLGINTHLDNWQKLRRNLNAKSARSRDIGIVITIQVDLLSQVKSSKTPPEAFKFNSVPQKFGKTFVTFHITKFNSSKDSNDEKLVSPLLDDAAPYSGIGFHEPKLLSPYLNINWNGKPEPLPEYESDLSHLQHRYVNHSSDSSLMFGMMVLQISYLVGS